MFKVLVADDEMPIRQWLEFCIRRIDGYEVVGAAKHGGEGFSMYRHLNPDIVITDIRMPIMDGLEMIKMIRNINPSVYTIIVTSHEDFEYARKAMSLGAVEYILKTEISDESLKAVLDKAAAVIGSDKVGTSKEQFEGISNRNHFLRSLVLNGHAVKLTEGMLTEYAIPLKKAPYYAINVCLPESGCTKIRFQDTECFDHLIKIPLDDHNIMLLGNLTEKCRNSTSGSRQACLAYVGKILEHHKCYVGVSELSDAPSQLAKQMIQAYYRSRMHFYHPRRRVFDTEDISVHRPSNGERYKILFNKELINQNYIGAAEIRKQMTEEIKAEQPADINYVKDLHSFFMTSLLHVTMEDLKTLEDKVSEIEKSIASCRNLEELNQFMEQIFYENTAKTRNTDEYSTTVRRAVAYLEEHYAEQITQTEVADFAGISTEYLSRIFKEETGVKFVVYLNNLRLKNALRLLETTNLKVYEVAEMVGYANLSYFSTIFKKNFGQNPFEYKRNYVGKR